MAKLFANDTIGNSYAEQLRKEHDGSKWGSTGARYSGGDVARLIHDRGYLRTALDYGCGKGTLAEAFPDLEWTNYDPGMPQWSEKPLGQFDLVTCTDVLEHVEIDLLDNVLSELASKTGKVLFLDIACYPTGKLFGEGPYIGRDLHLIVEEPEWWERRCGDVIDLHLAESKFEKKFSKGQYKDRAKFVFERV